MVVFMILTLVRTMPMQSSSTGLLQPNIPVNARDRCQPMVVLYTMNNASAYNSRFCFYLDYLQIKIEALNDSRQIGMCIYNVVVLSSVGLMLNLLLEDQEVRMYGVTTGCILIGTTATQLIVFMPKVPTKISLYRIVKRKQNGIYIKRYSLWNTCFV